MICPKCRVYDVDPRSDVGWCAKCTGVFTSQKLPPMCMACEKKEADPRSAHQFCMKCHFDFTEVVLGEEEAAFAAALKDCDAKEKASLTAWSAMAASVLNPKIRAKAAIAAYKLAEAEYIKALRQLHKVAKIVRK